MMANFAMGFFALVMATMFVQSLAMMCGFARRDADGSGGTSA